MAILRGGRRIFGRLKRTMGNPESTIGRFQSKMAEGEGFARPNRFMVDLFYQEV